MRLRVSFSTNFFCLAGLFAPRAPPVLLSLRFNPVKALRLANPLRLRLQIQPFGLWIQIQPACAGGRASPSGRVITRCNIPSGRRARGTPALSLSLSLSRTHTHTHTHSFPSLPKHSSLKGVFAHVSRARFTRNAPIVFMYIRYVWKETQTWRRALIAPPPALLQVRCPPLCIPKLLAPLLIYSSSSSSSSASRTCSSHSSAPQFLENFLRFLIATPNLNVASILRTATATATACDLLVLVL